MTAVSEASGPTVNYDSSSSSSTSSIDGAAQLAIRTLESMPSPDCSSTLLTSAADSALNPTGDPDWLTLRNACHQLRKKDKPISFTKPETYQHKTVTWLTSEIQTDLKTFEKNSRKLLNTLIFFLNNIQIFETGATKFSASDQNKKLLANFKTLFDQLKTLKLFTNKNYVEGIFQQYADIAKKEKPEKIDSATIQSFVKLGLYQSEDAFNQANAEKLTLSQDYHIKQMDMKQVWVRIDALVKEIQATIKRLDKIDFNAKINEEQVLANQRGTQINKWAQIAVNSYQTSILTELPTFLESTFRGQPNSSALVPSVSNPNSSTPLTPQAAPSNQQTALLSKICNANDFFMRLNWYLCETTKWLEHAQISFKSVANGICHAEKKEKDKEKFYTLLEVIQKAFRLMQNDYATHLKALEEVISMTEKPFEEEEILFLLKQGKQQPDLIAIEKLRAKNLEEAGFALTIIEKEWSELDKRIKQLTEAIIPFNEQPTSSNASSWGLNLNLSWIWNYNKS